MIKIPKDMIKGTIHKTNNYGYLKVVKYHGAKNVSVIFINTMHMCATQSSKIRLGRVKDPLSPCVAGVGFIGKGKYVVCENYKTSKAYKTWANMLERCYSDSFHDNNKTYIGCSVAEEWHNFQKFAKWHDDNYIHGYHLDKDILFQGNKIYSPETCIFVTQQVNGLLSDNGASRGEFKLGVSWFERDKKFKSQCNVNGVNVYIGLFNTENEAFESYKKYKYAVIKDVASKQSEPLKSALLAYKIT